MGEPEARPKIGPICVFIFILLRGLLSPSTSVVGYSGDQDPIPHREEERVKDTTPVIILQFEEEKDCGQHCMTAKVINTHTHTHTHKTRCQYSSRKATGIVKILMVLLFLSILLIKLVL